MDALSSNSTRRQRRSAITRERLLDAGLAVFLERGYDDTTLGEVTERADLGTGTIYLHFPAKRSLYEAVVRRALGEVYQRWESDDHARSGHVLGMVEVTLDFITVNVEQARLFLLDGPPVESWLVDEVARGIAVFLAGPQRELRATLIIGTALAAGRHYLRNPRQPGARTLRETTLAFCERGLSQRKAR